MKTTAPSDSPVIPAQWVWHYRVLCRLRDALLAQREERSARLRQPKGEAGPDPSDAALEEEERDELGAELARQISELVEVEEALARIRVGTYGRCGVTGEPIPPERLRAVPWTRYSLPVASRFEDAGDRPTSTVVAMALAG